MAIDRGLKLILSALCIIVGFLYYWEVFGQTEESVSRWGLISILSGLVIIPFSFFNNKVAKILTTSIIAVVVVIQIPPIILWFVFHGSGITDGTPPSDFVAHWLYSFPHIMITVIGLLVSKT
ncbi:hypothetical protein [Bacillus coahuilensis]|uniref:hypothetical protein n=1 Tax=Bacillus coahuilensis TaxID=408580 RepID=UPI0001850852|nr:hypothetical protein [Bacillus coahuilensis]